MSECEHACALVERQGALLLELRPPHARRAAGRLTCFGGKCRAEETPAQTLERELMEELAWPVEHYQPALALWKGSRLVAQFFTVADCPPQPLRVQEPHTRALWVPWATLPAVPLAPWHAAVVEAWRRGKQHLDLLNPRP